MAQKGLFFPMMMVDTSYEKPHSLLLSGLIPKNPSTVTE
jgi:hypothetical protein